MLSIKSFRFTKLFQTFIGNIYTPFGSLNLCLVAHTTFFLFNQLLLSELLPTKLSINNFLWFAFIIHFLFVYNCFRNNIWQKIYNLYFEYILFEYFLFQWVLLKYKNPFELFLILRNSNEWKWNFRVNYLILVIMPGVAGIYP